MISLRDFDSDGEHEPSSEDICTSTSSCPFSVQDDPNDFSWWAEIFEKSLTP